MGHELQLSMAQAPPLAPPPCGMATREGVQVTPTLCHPCGRHKDRCRCANAYNYHARRYFASELFRKEQIARRALANGAP
jgi:hypothetical protein